MIRFLCFTDSGVNDVSPEKSGEKRKSEVSKLLTYWRYNVRLSNADCEKVGKARGKYHVNSPRQEVDSQTIEISHQITLQDTRDLYKAVLKEV